MKSAHLLCLILILMLVFNAGSAEGNAFSFRNGVTWGMNPSEVIETEGPVEYIENEISIGRAITYEGISAAGTTASLNYYFINDMLVDISYNFDDSALDYDSLVASYTAKYGQPGEIAPERIINGLKWMMDEAEAGEDLTLEDLLGTDEGLAWDTDDAYIVIYRAYRCNVMYMNEALTRQAVETLREANKATINTDGI